MPFCAFTKFRVPRLIAVLGRFTASCILICRLVDYTCMCYVQIVYRLSHSSLRVTVKISLLALLTCLFVFLHQPVFSLSRHFTVAEMLSDALFMLSTFQSISYSTFCTLDICRFFQVSLLKKITHKLDILMSLLLTLLTTATLSCLLLF